MIYDSERMISGKIPRYEMKYLIPANQVEAIRTWLEALCFRDKNAGPDGCYNIRSMYFDDYHRSSYFDNEIGYEPRSKYRIRTYNCDENILMLEQKIKIGGKIQKYRANLSRDFYEGILREEELPYSSEESLINRFLLDCQSKCLRPAVIVDYEREPFVYSDGDVRITFDRDISFSAEFGDFFDKSIYLQPILPVGMELLEVKYTEFLPEFIHKQLNRFHLQKCTFSKYYLCEKFRRMGE